MAPGILLPESGIDFLKNRRMAVVFAGSNIPVGVGYSPRTELVTTRAQLVDKALIITHIFGDELWKSGSKQTIDDELLSRFETHTIVDTEEDLAQLELAQVETAPSETENVENQTLPLSSSSPNDADASPTEISTHVPVEVDEDDDEAGDADLTTESMTTAEMDSLVVTAFLQALKKRVKQKDLPMLASKFWAEYCLPSRPRGSVISWKKTSFKKLISFLEEQVRAGVICINTTDQGVTSLVAIIHDHPLLENFRTLNLHETAQADLEVADEEVDESKPVIQDLWTLHKRLEFLLIAYEEDEAHDEEDHLAEVALLKAHLKSSSERTKYFTKPQINGLLWKYVTMRELADTTNAKNILLDLNLCTALYPGGKAQVGQSVSKKDLSELFNAKIVPIQIVKVNGEVKVEKGKGKVGSITVLVEARGGSKLVTRIQGLHHFGLDVKDVAKKASKKFASSAGQGKDAMGFDELLLQGNLEKTAPAFLTQEYNIPTKHIKVEVKGNVKKKK